MAGNFADSNRARLRVLPEDSNAWGTVKSSGTPREVRMTGSALAPTKETVSSNELRADRMVPNIIEVGAGAEGDIQFEFSAGAMDDFLAAFVYGLWSKPMTFDFFKGVKVSIKDSDEIEIAGGDYTAYFTATRVVKLEGFKTPANNTYATIDSVAYNGGTGITTLTISGAVLVAESGTVYTKVMDANDVIVQSTAIRFGTGSTATIDSATGDVFESARTAGQLKVGQKIHIDGLGFDVGTITVSPNAAPGDIVTIDDSVNQVSFQFEGTILPGNVSVAIGGEGQASGANLAAAINEAYARGDINVMAAAGAGVLGVAASAVLTPDAQGAGSGLPANGETVIIGSKTYTFQTVLSNTDGYVTIGSDIEETLANLAAAINLGAGAGTAYAASTTANTDVSAVSDATTLTVTALVPGTAGNAIGTSGTYPASDDADWDDSNLTGGIDGEGELTITNYEAEGGSITKVEGAGIAIVDFAGGDDSLRGIFTITSVGDDVIGLFPAPATNDNSGTKKITIKGSMLRNPSLPEDFVRQSFSAEMSFMDVNQHFVGSGLKVGTFGLSVTAGEIVTGSVDFMGRSMERRRNQTSKFDSEGDYDNLRATENEILNATTNVGDVFKNGAVLATALQSIEINGDASLREQRKVGDKYLAGVGLGRFQLTGSMTAYFDTAEMFDHFVDHDTVSLGWFFKDLDGNRYDFTIPAIKITSDPVRPEGIDQDVVEEMEWEAQRDPATECMIQIDRFSSLKAATA